MHSNQLRRTNHANVIKLRRIVDGSTGLQSDKAGHKINISKKSFKKDVYKLLNRNLN